jgi:hypothetical protein
MGENDLIQLGSLGDSVDSGSGYASVPTADQLTPTVDSSGNSLTLPQGLQAGGSLLSIAGDIISGDESQQADDYNASLALMQGQFNVNKLDLSETNTLSTQKAMYAKSGVEMSGSPLDTQLNTASQFEMDKQIETYNAASAANMDTYEGKVAKQQSEFKAAGDALQGLEQVGMLAAMAG